MTVAMTIAEELREAESELERAMQKIRAGADSVPGLHRLALWVTALRQQCQKSETVVEASR